MELLLTKGYVAMVDDDDNKAPWRFKWTADVRKDIVYAYRQINNCTKKVYLHRFLLNTKLDVDHIDGNGLNNRRSNLRAATVAQNIANSRLCSTNTSGYKGVCWHKDAQKWVAGMHINNKRIYLGLFNNKEEAARAYDTAVVKHFGEYALTNAMLTVV